MPTETDIARYKANLQDERDSTTLYQALAATEKDAHLAEIYQRLAGVEERHAARWEDLLRQSGQAVPKYQPGWRIRALKFLACRFGAATILPMVTSMEANATHAYDQQPEARAAGMPAEERSHARIFGYLRAATRGGIPGPALAQLEGRHRNTGGGNALRAAVLGASDGLTSNMSLVMGVAGASLSGHTIFLTGISGLLAGALSMAIGEWLSVQSARELYSHQIDVERAELREVPEEEREELTLIYQAKGLQEQEAKALADRLLSDETTALDTLAREELGIDPKELGGSAWQAAITSFLLFAVGAIIPAAPFAFGGGMAIVAISLGLSVVGLFLIGTGITLTTGVPLLKAGSRQVIFGVAAAAITFGVGRLFGSALGG
ncbi:MAG TPA: VIT1/CCC1 family protein [Ktedonobacterales bacterium]